MIGGVLRLPAPETSPSANSTLVEHLTGTGPGEGFWVWIHIAVTAGALCWRSDTTRRRPTRTSNLRTASHTTGTLLGFNSRLHRCGRNIRSGMRRRSSQSVAVARRGRWCVGDMNVSPKVGWKSVVLQILHVHVGQSGAGGQ